LNKGVVVGGKTIDFNSTNLFQRLLILVERSADIPSYFAYELTPIPLSLFKDGLMRKADKPALAKFITADLPWQDCPSGLRFVVDGGCLLHRVRWEKNKTYLELVLLYVNRVIARFGVGSVVVFDGYGTKATTKDHEHKRRAMKAVKVSPEVAIDESTVAVFEQHSFLANDRNKDQFIQMLVHHMNSKGLKAFQATADADTDIVAAAISHASTPETTAVFADDTDILVLLVYHLKASMADVYFVSDAKKKGCFETKSINVRSIQKKLKPDACSQLLVIHALGGCDTVSAIFGHGKATVFQKVTKCPSAKKLTDTIQDATATKEQIITAGIRLIVLLYGGKPTDTLQKMRYDSYSKMVAASTVRPHPERLPPTNKAAEFHILRTHLQAVVWQKLSCAALKPEEWGWEEQNGKLMPIMTDDPVAPDDVLNVVRCKCKAGCNSKLCSCRQNGICCVSACSNCHGDLGCSNGQLSAAVNADTESNCDDDDDVDDADDDVTNTTLLQSQIDDYTELLDYIYDTDIDWIHEETVEEIVEGVVHDTVGSSKELGPVSV